MVIKNEKFVRAFGKNLRKIRIAKNISQEDLANDADIPINQVGRIERGEINTTIVTVKALADALKMDVIDLLNF